MSTSLLDREGRDEIQRNVATIIENSATLEETRNRIGIFAREIYSDNIERVAENQKDRFKEWLARVEDSLKAHAESLNQALTDARDSKGRDDVEKQYETFMLTEFLQIFCQLSAIAE